jgi:cobyrinic acid a,c-diamide synthase
MHAFAVAGTNSGCGKTTITLGLMAALKNKGLVVQGFKAGPDFIDAGIHSLITGRQSRNLDIWMCGEDFVRHVFNANAATPDVSIVEGVMGMFDGENNTAKLANMLNLPVVLIVDAYGAAESVGAIVRGFVDTGVKDYGVKFAGVILNRIASENHFLRVKKSITQVPVFGYLSREAEFKIAERHLGLVTAAERPFTNNQLDQLANAITDHVDLDKLLEAIGELSVSRVGSDTQVIEPESICRVSNKENCATGDTKQNAHASGLAMDTEQNAQVACMTKEADSTKLKHKNNKNRIMLAVALDKAFCFYYEDNLDLLREYGAEIIPFSPLTDEGIPPKAEAIYIGGGYPELYALELSKNKKMLRSIKDWSRSGRPLYAECGGLMYLSNSLKDLSGNKFEMTGVFPFNASMRKKPVLGYREIRLIEDTLLGNKDTLFRGHEFHYSEIDMEMAQYKDVYSVVDNRGSIKKESGGYKLDNTLASYVHVHFGSNKLIAKKMVESIAEIAKSNG